MGLTITVKMEVKCVECGKGGATQNGICLQCLNKVMRGKQMKSREGRAVQKNFENLKRNRANQG